MKFTVGRARQAAGSDLQVFVSTLAAENDPVHRRDPGRKRAGRRRPAAKTEFYGRAYSAAGAAGPMFEHALEVTAVDQSGDPHRSIKTWIDGS